MFKGYRTYAIAIGILALGIAEHFGYKIPAETWPILGALGLGGIRAAIDDSAPVA